MESGEDDICEEYKESLEDLTFNSKPLINVLTMLAEENSQHASSFTKLIANRIRQVQQQYKLPSLYLLDSIVKNVGGDYLHLVAQIMEETFSCVFEKADEKTRRDLYKLRHTWSPYFPAKLLHELDVAVNKHDPGWPIAAAPPPSPSIHINPKFLKKTENAGGVASLTAEISTPEEHHVVEGHQQRLLELERLQQEQLKLTELEIQEHQMKRDLLLKKQQQERQQLLQQQQQDILHLRLNTDEPDLLLTNGPPSTVAPVLTKAETTESNPIDPRRDPRLRRNEQEPARQPVKERILIENQDTLPLRVPLPFDHGHEFEDMSSRLAEHISHYPQPDSEMSHFQETRTQQNMAFVEPPVESMSRVQPVAYLEREVTGSPKYDDLHLEPRPKHNHRRRNSGDWSGHASGHENISEDPLVPRIQGGRGKLRKARRRSAERKERERGKGGRGRGQDRNRGNRDTGSDGFQNSEFGSETRFARRVERRIADRPVDDWNSDLDQRTDNYAPRKDRPPHRGKWKKDHIVYVRGKDHDEIIKGASPSISERRLIGMGSERDRFENIEPQLRGTQMCDDQVHHREHDHPVFEDPWDLSIGEPLAKKPRPLLSDVEINELRNRKGASPSTGRMTPPPILQGGFHDVPYDRGDHPFPHNVDSPFHPKFGPLPPEEHHREWAPAFEIPRELTLDHQSEIMIQADRRLQAGDLTVDQHHELVDKLHQLFELQRRQEQMRCPPDIPPHPHLECHPRPMLPHGPDPPLDVEGPPDVGPARQGPPRFQEHRRIPPRGPDLEEPHGPGIRRNGPRFENSDSHMRRLHEDFKGPPVDHDPHPLSIPMQVGPDMHPIRSDRMLEGPPKLDGASNPPFVHGRPLEEMPAPRTPPRQSKDEALPPHTPNTMMEKRAVDDLFRKLMEVGIIKVTPEPGHESPQHIPSPGPPQAEVQQPQPPPVKPVSVPSVLPLLNAVLSKKDPPVVKEPIPVIKLVPDELKRRHSGVINSLYEGTQCSSCGLRFPGEASKIYGEHLDWHFRKNRREKDSRRVAHRMWYLIINDWLDYEEISDPDERARSSFFDVSTKAVDSPDPLKEAKEGTEGEGSCPVLSGDSQAEAECDICCEKFEQFWEETNEEWHYKFAVRIDGKTYHLLCYQDAKENQGHDEDDNEQEEESMDTDANHSSPVKDEEKMQNKEEQATVNESKMTQNDEASKFSTLREKTVESEVKSSGKDLCKVENTGPNIKGSSISNNSVDNKENETKGDDK